MIARLLSVRPLIIPTPPTLLRAASSARFLSTETDHGSSSTQAPPPIPSTPPIPPVKSPKTTLLTKPFDPSIPPTSLLKPGILDVPHTHPVALLHFRTYHPPTLSLFLHFAYHAALALQIPLSHPAHLPTKRSLFTVPKSPFIFKKAQENFERKTHKRAVKVWNADPEVINVWLRYLEEHMMPGIGMRVVRWERAEVGVGGKRLGEVGAALRGSGVGGGEGKMLVSEQVRAIGEKIIEQETEAAKKAQREAVPETPKAA
ncbi:ribosomal protein S10 [Ceratobasidium sp. AG-I]|nr:ribosomal protein S10 [Ceratobasidium sp. AG-I]